VHLTIYSSGTASCISGLKGLEISIDWYATLGRCASRYLTTTIAWAAGVSSLTLFLGLGKYDRGGALCMLSSQLLMNFCLIRSFIAPMPSLDQSMRRYSQLLWRSFLPMSLLASFMPWPTKLYLGLGIAGPFAPLAPLILLTASGLVIAIWWILIGFKWLLRPVGRVFVARWSVCRFQSRINSEDFGIHRNHEGLRIGRSTAFSTGIIIVVIFLLVPWQVAYLGCWIYQLMSCAVSSPEVIGRRTVDEYPLSDRSSDDTIICDSRTNEQVQDKTSVRLDNYHLSCHVLLLMTWLLPLAAPVLAVWVRTTITAGLTSPFDGDHFFLSVAPFLVLVDFSSRADTPILVRHRCVMYDI